VKWARRRPAVAALLATVVLVTGVGFGLVTWKWGEAIDAQQETAEALDKAEADRRKAVALSHAEARARAEADQRARAETAARKDAEREKRRAEAAERKVREQLLREEVLRHGVQNGLIQRELQAHNLFRAEQLLKDYPRNMRRWEYGYLQQLCQKRLRTF